MEVYMKLKVDFKNTVGRIKPMNAVNNGPVYTDNGDQNLTNLPDFREANIPFARTHDSPYAMTTAESTRSIYIIYLPISTPTRIRPSPMTSR